MTLEEARIILLCHNVVDVIFAQTQGALSEELLNQDGKDGFDLDILKEEAIKVVLKELYKQDKEINKLNNVIDRMAERFARNFCFAPLNEKCNQSAKDFTNEKCIECIKEYFMKEE